MTASIGTIHVDLAGTLGAFKLDVAFDGPQRGITALFGPSGSGKTTILRCIAGLTRLPGRITVGDETWQDVRRKADQDDLSPTEPAAGMATGRETAHAAASRTWWGGQPLPDQHVFVAPHRRRVGYVFQEASLFAHLSVRDNLLFGARRTMARAAHTGLAPDFDATVALLGLRPLLARRPEHLSGGERQRVAVGRALLSAPALLLMDEPLSALDRASRDEILPYFERLRAASAIPILYVSHELAEVERLADHLVLLDGGRVTAAGPLTTLQTDPALPLLGAANASVVIDATVAMVDDGFALTTCDVDGGRLIVVGRHGRVGDRLRLRIAATDVSLARSAATDSTILNILTCTIVCIDSPPGEPHTSVVLALRAPGGGALHESSGSRPAASIIARITSKSRAALGLAVGDIVVAQIKGVAVATSRDAAP